jgi:hypothetical protein
MAACGAVMLLVGSLLFAAVVSDEGNNNSFGNAFLGFLGIAIVISGIGILIASATTYLTRRD